MRVAFDQQVFLLQEYGGISRYLCSLVREMAVMPVVTARVFAPLHVNRNLAGLGSEFSRGLTLSALSPKFLRLAMFASKVMARREMARFKPDIVHETYYSEDDFRPNGARRILTVYDLIHERYPDLFVNSEGTTRPKRIAANRADHVICISESTRRDLVSYCGVPEERTSVVYLGVDVDFVQAPIPTRQYHARPFLLYVGARGGYKNFARFVRAFAMSSRLRKEFDLLCFGGGPLHAAERQMIAEAGLPQSRWCRWEGATKFWPIFTSRLQPLFIPLCMRVSAFHLWRQWRSAVRLSAATAVHCRKLSATLQKVLIRWTTRPCSLPWRRCWIHPVDAMLWF